MIEKFTKDEFENCIEEICEELDLHHYGTAFLDGEWCWSIPLDVKVFINIRSSIGRDYFAKDTGEDSIRLILCAFSEGIIGKDSARWITRVSGWDSRLKTAIRKLNELRKNAGDCPDCNKPLHIYKVKKSGKNHGRLFATCTDKNHHSGWIWLTDAK